jgi:hypothetical protein
VIVALVMAFVTASDDRVPTLVRLEATTVDFSVVPVNVVAAAVTVIAAVPLKLTPLMALVVARAVAVAAVPDVFWLPAAFTPGKLILADPLKDTPPIVLAVLSVAADPAVRGTKSVAILDSWM